MRRQEELTPERLNREHQEHWAILAALGERDSKRAEEAIRGHIRNLSQELTEVLGIPSGLVEPLLTF
jgi:DNA-binding GntR family transcriptional regulator